MDFRFKALVRQATPYAPKSVLAPAVVDPLVATLIANITRKREYDDVLQSEKTAAAFGSKHGLTDEQTQLLVLMQRHKSVFVPNPWLDHFLTVLFIVEVLLVSWDMAGKGVLIMFALCLLLTDAVISRVKTISEVAGRAASRWLHERGFVGSDPLSGRIQMKKWTDQSWQLFVHVLFAGIEGYILSEEPWLTNSETVWMPHPDKQVGTHRTDMVILYMAQLSVWVYTCIIHRFFDERRKDYFVLYIHHIVTIALVGSSWAAGYLRIGLMVLWVHDASDILVDSLKMVNYLKLEGPKGFFASEITYVSTIVGWIYWRLYQYPFKVIKCAFIDSFNVLRPLPRVDDGFLGLFPPDLYLYTESNALLFTLLGLHIYWFFLFLRIGYRILTESMREASRQEYEGDSDDDLEDEPAQIDTAAVNKQDHQAAGKTADAVRKRR